MRIRKFIIPALCLLCGSWVAGCQTGKNSKTGCCAPSTATASKSSSSGTRTAGRLAPKAASQAPTPASKNGPSLAILDAPPVDALPQMAQMPEGTPIQFNQPHQPSPDQLLPDSFSTPGNGVSSGPPLDLGNGLPASAPTMVNAPHPLESAPLVETPSSDPSLVSQVTIKYGASDNYRVLTGQVSQFRRELRLRYTDPGSDDPYGGSVVLEGTQIDDLKDGYHVRVEGQIIPPAGRGGSARFQVSRMQILAK